MVPLFPFYLGVSLLKLNIKKKGTPTIKGLGNLDIIMSFCSTSKEAAAQIALTRQYDSQKF